MAVKGYLKIKGGRRRLYAGAHRRQRRGARPVVRRGSAWARRCSRAAAQRDRAQAGEPQPRAGRDLRAEIRAQDRMREALFRHQQRLVHRRRRHPAAHRARSGVAQRKLGLGYLHCSSGCRSGRSPRRSCCIRPGPRGVTLVTGPGSRIGNFFSALIITLFALPFSGGLVFGVYMFGVSMSYWATGALIAGGVLAYVFYHLLKAPTALGAQTLDQIDGFKMYLETAREGPARDPQPAGGDAGGVREIPCPTPSRSTARTVEQEVRGAGRGGGMGRGPELRLHAAVVFRRRVQQYRQPPLSSRRSAPRSAARRQAPRPRRDRVRAPAAAGSRAAAGAAAVAAAGRLARRIVLAACFALAALTPAQAFDYDAFERIINFVSDTTVEPDGTIKVRETITFNVLGDFITHGIKRDFLRPRPARRHEGRVHGAVGHDGRQRRALQRRPDRRRQGDQDRRRRCRPAHGHHVFVIDYTTDRQIRFFPKYDEFYWNATGNGWSFQILPGGSRDPPAAGARASCNRRSIPAPPARAARRPRRSGSTTAPSASSPPIR